MSDIVNLWYTWRKTMAQLEFLSDWRTSRDEHERNIWTHSGDDGAGRKQLNPKIAARLIEVGTEEAKHMLAGAEPSGPASQNPTPFKPLLASFPDVARHHLRALMARVLLNVVARHVARRGRRRVAARHQGHELVGFRLASAPEPRELVHPILDDARDAAIGEPLVATIALSGPLPRCLRCSRLARQLDA